MAIRQDFRCEGKLLNMQDSEKNPWDKGYTTYGDALYPFVSATSPYKPQNNRHKGVFYIDTIKDEHLSSFSREHSSFVSLIQHDKESEEFEGVRRKLGISKLHAHKIKEYSKTYTQLTSKMPIGSDFDEDEKDELQDLEFERRREAAAFAKSALDQTINSLAHSCGLPLRQFDLEVLSKLDEVVERLSYSAFVKDAMLAETRNQEQKAIILNSIPKNFFQEFAHRFVEAMDIFFSEISTEYSSLQKKLDTDKPSAMGVVLEEIRKCSLQEKLSEQAQRQLQDLEVFLDSEEDCGGKTSQHFGRPIANKHLIKHLIKLVPFIERELWLSNLYNTFAFHLQFRLSDIYRLLLLCWMFVNKDSFAQDKEEAHDFFLPPLKFRVVRSGSIATFVGSYLHLDRVHRLQDGYMQEGYKAHLCYSLFHKLVALKKLDQDTNSNLSLARDEEIFASFFQCLSVSTSQINDGIKFYKEALQKIQEIPWQPCFARTYSQQNMLACSVYWLVRKLDENTLNESELDEKNFLYKLPHNKPFFLVSFSDNLNCYLIRTSIEDYSLEFSEKTVAEESKDRWQRIPRSFENILALFKERFSKDRWQQRIKKSFEKTLAITKDRTSQNFSIQSEIFGSAASRFSQYFDTEDFTAIASSMSMFVKNTISSDETSIYTFRAQLSSDPGNTSIPIELEYQGFFASSLPLFYRKRDVINHLNHTYQNYIQNKLESNEAITGEGLASIIFRCYIFRVPIFLTKADDNACVRDKYHELKPHSYLVVPLLFHERVMGVIESKSYSLGKWGEADVALLMQMASRITPYFYYQRLSAALNNISSHSLAIAEIDAELGLKLQENSKQEIKKKREQAYRRICQDLCEIFLTCSASIWVKDKDDCLELYCAGDTSFSLASFVAENKQQLRTPSKKNVQKEDFSPQHSIFQYVINRLECSQRGTDLVFDTASAKPRYLYARIDKHATKSHFNKPSGVLVLGKDYLENQDFAHRAHLVAFQEMIVFPIYSKLKLEENVEYNAILGFVVLRNDIASSFTQDWDAIIELVNESLASAFEHLGLVTAPAKKQRGTQAHQMRMSAINIFSKLESLCLTTSFLRHQAFYNWKNTARVKMKQLEMQAESSTTLKKQDVQNMLESIFSQHSEKLESTIRDIDTKLQSALKATDTYLHMDVGRGVVKKFSPKNTPQFSRLSLEQLFDDAFQAVKLKLRKKGIVLSRLADNAVSSIHSIEEEWDDIFNTLLENVEKYALHHSVVDFSLEYDRLEISNKCILEESYMQDAKKLLEYGVRGKFSRNIAGEGIGLHHVKEICYKLGFEILVSMIPVFAKNEYYPNQQLGKFSITIIFRR